MPAWMKRLAAHRPQGTRLAAWVCGVALVLGLMPAEAPVASAATPPPNAVIRLFGATSVDTAVEISRNGWPAGSTSYAIIATGNTFPDALAGGPLAMALNAPILLTSNKSSGLETAVKNELQRLKVTNVVILGGTAVVSAGIEKQLASTYAVQRLGGTTRYDTAMLIAEDLKQVRGDTPTDTVFLTDGTNYPDALGIAPVAARLGMPILFTPKNKSLNTVTAGYLAAEQPSALYVLGGVGAVPQKAMDQAASVASAQSVTRVAGVTRYDTNIAIYDQWQSMFPPGGVISLATGRNFPDALTGGVFAAKQQAPLFLVDGLATKASTALKAAAASVGPTTAYVFGGTAVTTAKIVNLTLGNTTTRAPDIIASSVVNYRDVAGTGAGLPLANGGHMARGLVYRAAALETMSKADKALVASTGLTDIYDLRTPDTVAKHPDPKIGTATNHLVNLYATPKAKSASGSTADARLASRVEINREFVTDSAERARLAVLLNSFAAVNGPVIIHCSEGKDRTGFVSAVLQLVAGVDESTIMSEYLMSNDARKALIDADVAKGRAKQGNAAADERLVDLTVHPEQLQASLDAISANYGGIDGFLTTGVGLSAATVATIRAKVQAG